MAAEGSTRVVLAALAFNGLIAVSKFVASAITGSAAMLSEAVHSVADYLSPKTIAYMTSDHMGSSSI